MRINIYESTMSKASRISYIFPSLRFARITEGEVEWQIGERIYHFCKGDIILLNNLTARKMLNINGERLKMEVFEFSPEEIINRPKLVSIFYGEATSAIRVGESPIITDILDLLKKADDNDTICYHLLQSIFCVLEDLFSASTVSGTGSLAFAAAGYIWENSSRDITVPKVAEHLNVSKSHLEKEFKRVHGIGVGEYIRNIRVHNASRLLRTHPERSVLDIALSCGFKSSSGFYKAYRTVIGEKPKKENPLST